MKIRLLTLLLIPALLCGTSLTAQAGPMHAALSLLEQAKAKLRDEATADKGGHRVKSIKAINDAIAEVNAGIEFDKANTGPNEGKRRKQN